jgi:hypothetical protein
MLRTAQKHFAVPAVKGQRCNALTHDERIYPGSNRIDDSGDLVPGNERHFRRVGIAAGKHHQVGGTGPCGGHPHAQLPGRRRLDRQLDDVQQSGPPCLGNITAR